MDYNEIAVAKRLSDTLLCGKIDSTEHFSEHFKANVFRKSVIDIFKKMTPSIVTYTLLSTVYFSVLKEPEFAVALCSKNTGIVKDLQTVCYGHNPSPSLLVNTIIEKCTASKCVRVVVLTNYHFSGSNETLYYSDKIYNGLENNGISVIDIIHTDQNFKSTNIMSYYDKSGYDFLKNKR